MCSNKNNINNKIVVFLIFNVMNLSKTDWVEVSQFSAQQNSARKFPSVLQSSLLTKSSFLNHVLSQDESVVVSQHPELKAVQSSSKIITRDDLRKAINLPRPVTVKYDPNRINRKNHQIQHNTTTVTQEAVSEFTKQTESTDATDEDDGVIIEDDDNDGERGSDDSVDYEVPEIVEKVKVQLKPKAQPQRVKPKSNENLSFSGFMGFLKNIQGSLVFRTARGINDKIKVLKNFKNKLLLNIVERVKNLWPDKPRRVKRGLMGGSEHGGLDFPSAEGALMTISFLTFAVFLIKLVLQVINTIKSKHYSYNGFDTSQINSMKLIKKHRNARKLSISDEDDIENVVKAAKNLHSNLKFP